MLGASLVEHNDEQEDAFKKERRIYLWDVTISMVGATKSPEFPTGGKRSAPDFDYAKSGFPNYNAEKNIFDGTREKLIKLIYQIQNESTEIIVLPFRNGIVGEFKANATAEGKEQIKNQIMTWNDLQPGGTFTATCLENAVNKYFTKDRINRLFLLTDGEPSNDEGTKLIDYLNKWKGVKETKGQSCYLVYVMLTDEAYNEDIMEIGKNSDGDIIVTNSFEEPVWLSIGHNVSIYVRDYLDGKASSDGKGKIEIPYTFVAGTEIPENSVFFFSVEDNDFLTIDSSIPIRPSGGKFLIPFSLVKTLDENLKELPQDYDYVINGEIIKSPEANSNVDITGSNVVGISLVMKSEPRVSISWSKK